MKIFNSFFEPENGLFSGGACDVTSPQSSADKCCRLSMEDRSQNAPCPRNKQMGTHTPSTPIQAYFEWADSKEAKAGAFFDPIPEDEKSNDLEGQGRCE